MPVLSENDGKALTIVVENHSYMRFPIKTKVVTNEDVCEDVVYEYVNPNMHDGDVIFISEKMIACTQGRAIQLDCIHPSRLARMLSRCVTKTAYGIGLSMPETMEMALRECGVIRILFAAFCGMIGKLLRRKGWFYKIAGDKAAGIDGPCDCTIPPYNHYVVLTPQKPDDVAQSISKKLGGACVLIVDINDLGGKILGMSHHTIEKEFYLSLLKDNPLGQGAQSTPIGLIRQVV